MGVYLTKPVTDKLSEEFVSASDSCHIKGAVVSMQGWRMDQEDAHNLIHNFDDGVSFFGIYDGHGGAEVSAYIAQTLPEFVKNHKLYAKPTLESAIKNILIDFDRHLVQPETTRKLNAIATESKDANEADGSPDGIDADDGEEVDVLRQDAKRSIQEVIRQYYSSSNAESDTAEGDNPTEKGDDGGLVKRSLVEALMGDDNDDDSQDDTSSSDGEHIAEENMNDESETSSEDDEDEDEEDDDAAANKEDPDDETMNGSTDDEVQSAENCDSQSRTVPKIGECVESLSGPGFDSGSTAVVALLIDCKRLLVANLGDSRCVLARGKTAIDLTHDHKPSDDVERKRIEHAGGAVTADGRVNHGLNLSRALGDHSYKQRSDLKPEEQMISCEADVRVVDLDLANDKFIVIACDGIWNSMTNQEVVDFINERLDQSPKTEEVAHTNGQDGTNLTQIIGELFDRCLAEDTYGDGTGCDNMTAMIIQLSHVADGR